MLSKWYAYLLKLDGGFYYVGISRHPAERIYCHKQKEGSKLTKKYDVEKVMAVWEIGILNIEQALDIEQRITQGMTSVYGNKVRGGSRSQEECGYVTHGLGARYVQQFKNVTAPVLGELTVIEERGWA